MLFSEQSMALGAFSLSGFSLLDSLLFALLVVTFLPGIPYLPRADAIG